ncbi:MAG: TlpA family protein disulfide reductase [Bacillota bacterium]
MSKKSILLITLLVIGIIIFGLYFVQQQRGKESTDIDINELVFELDSILTDQEVVGGLEYSDFSFTNPVRGEFKLSEYQSGDEMVVIFWSCSCPPSIGTMPILMKVKEKYDNLKIITINLQDEEEVLFNLMEGELDAHPGIVSFPSRYEERFESDWRLTLDVIYDREGRLEDFYRIKGTPTSLFIDPEGKVRIFYLGGMTEEAFAGAIKEMRYIQKQQLYSSKEIVGGVF